MIDAKLREMYSTEHDLVTVRTDQEQGIIHLNERGRHSTTVTLANNSIVKAAGRGEVVLLLPFGDITLKKTTQLSGFAKSRGEKRKQKPGGVKGQRPRRGSTSSC